MYRAGNETKPIESAAYLRYDCNTRTVYVLVLTLGVPGLDGPTYAPAAWAAINTASNKRYTGNSGNDGIPPDFEWVGSKYDGDPQHVQGYEASFQLSPGSYKIIVHIEVFDSGAPQTSATAGFPGTGIDLWLDCTNVTAPAIQVNKLVSVDGMATWLDAQTSPGPTVYQGNDVFFKFIVTNTGNVDLSNVTLTDPTYDVYYPVGSLAAGSPPVEYVIGPYLAGLGPYTNTATATGYHDGNPYSDTDVANYYGAKKPDPQISLIKYTNGDDAIDAPGPQLFAGDPVTWTYVVTNTGNVDLTDVIVTDDMLGEIGTIPLLLVGATETYEATGTATAGQYGNTAIAACYYNKKAVTATAVSHYYGTEPLPGIDVVKLTQGFDWAHEPPGPYVLVGDPVTWTYIVTNTGNVPLTNVTVVDDMVGLIPCTIPNPLPAGQSYVCETTGAATLGQYNNTATATGYYKGAPVSDEDTSHYFGALPSISVVKYTNGLEANTEPGPYILVGDKVTWTYLVTNTGNADLTNVTVTDDMLGTTVCTIASLPAGTSETCTATGTASAGQYTNTATVTGTPPGGLADVTATDESHYFGAQPSITVKKSTNGEDADAAPGPYILVGNPITWTYVVTNTGNVDLTGVTVTDDKLGKVVCAIALLPTSASETCTADGTALVGEYENTATATGTPPGGLSAVTATDLSHYFGAAPSIGLVKYVSVDGGKNWLDANTSPWPQVLTGGQVFYKYVVTNTGNVTLENITLTDPAGGCPIPATLAPGQSSECQYGPLTVAYGLNANTATAAGSFGGNTYTHTDSASYFGTLCSYTQGGYAGGGRPGQILSSYFTSAFPSGLQVGSYFPGNGTTFPNGYLWQPNSTGLKNLKTYLAGGGTSGYIRSDQLNPTKDPTSGGGGTLAKQAVTLALNIAFSGSNPSMPGGYGSLYYCSSGDSLSGQTLSEILVRVNDALANGATSLPSNHTYASLNTLLNDLNRAFDNGTATEWAQAHLFSGACP